MVSAPPGIDILVVDARRAFFFLVTIDEEEFRMPYEGGIIEASGKHYFLMTPAHGCETQRLFRMEEVQTRVESTAEVPKRLGARKPKSGRARVA